MRFARNGDIDLAKLGQELPENKRRHGRVKCAAVPCSIGEILDLSASGMRVRTRMSLPAPGELFVINLPTPQGPLAVLSRIRWVRKLGWFRREVGIEFYDVGEHAKLALQEMARRVPYNGGGMLA